MPRNPKVTIWIPSYNHARFLPASIESALGQTYQNIEIIIVDDGSTDDSLQVAQSYAAKYPSLIQVFTHPEHKNRGISATVNFAFQHSSGEYVSGLPSDDVLYPNKVEEQVAFLERYPETGWVYGEVHYINEAGERLPDIYKLFVTDLSSEPYPVERLIKGNVVPGMAVLARRECFEKAGPHDETLIYSDWAFWLRMLASCKVGYINKPLVMYRVHTYNTGVGIEFEENVRRGLAVLTSIRENAPEIGGALNTPRMRALIDLQRSLLWFSLKGDKAATESFRAALEADLSLREDVRYVANWLKTSWGGYYFAKWVIEQFASEAGEQPAKLLRKEMFKWLSTQEAIECRKSGNLKTARKLAAISLMSKPYGEESRLLASLLLETLVGADTMNKVRQVKKRIS